MTDDEKAAENKVDSTNCSPQAGSTSSPQAGSTSSPQADSTCSPQEDGTFGRRAVMVTLLLILALAGLLRLYKLGQSPPGLNPDEAVNGWNAYCLLKTGKDQAGVSWPIFYIRGIGGQASTLYMYLTMPFQAFGGLNVITTRLGGAVSGILTVLVIYFVGRRLFDRTVGLMAAFLLALNPWHIQLSRWGHESSLGALLGIAPLALLLWAKMPISENETGPPKPVLALLGGIITGIGCYGYHAVRIFVPIFLLAIVLFTLPKWRRCIKTRKGALAALGFIVGFVVTFGPLAWQHIFNPEGIGRHGLSHDKMGLFLASAPFWTAVTSMFGRYIHHFGPEFLFTLGDYNIIQQPPGCGEFHWYMLPLMILGLVYILKNFKTSVSARIALAFVLVYPVGDCLYRMNGMHALRSSPGLCSLILAGAAGGVAGARWLWSRNRLSVIAVLTVFAISVAGINAKYFQRFYVEYNRNPDIYYLYSVDIVEACEWLRPRFNDFDVILFDDIGMAYIVAIAAVGYEPDLWFSEPNELHHFGEWDFYSRCGKMHFMNDHIFSSMDDFTNHSLGGKEYPPGRILLIVRPGTADLNSPAVKLIRKICRPDGAEMLWLCKI